MIGMQRRGVWEDVRVPPGRWIAVKWPADGSMLHTGSFLELSVIVFYYFNVQPLMLAFILADGLQR